MDDYQQTLRYLVQIDLLDERKQITSTFCVPGVQRAMKMEDLDWPRIVDALRAVDPQAATVPAYEQRCKEVLHTHLVYLQSPGYRLSAMGVHLSPALKQDALKVFTTGQLLVLYRMMKEILEATMPKIQVMPPHPAPAGAAMQGTAQVPPPAPSWYAVAQPSGPRGERPPKRRRLEEPPPIPSPPLPVLPEFRSPLANDAELLPMQLDQIILDQEDTSLDIDLFFNNNG